MSKKSDQKPIVVYVEFDERNQLGQGYRHITARVCRMERFLTTDNHDRPVSIDTYDNKHAMARIDSQTDNDKLGNDDASAANVMYGESISWRSKYSYGASLSELESGVKSLKAITRYLEKASEINGAPASFGAYVLRFAHAIGASAIVLDRSEDRAERFGSPYETQPDLGYACLKIDNKIREWIDSRIPYRASQSA